MTKKFLISLAFILFIMFFILINKSFCLYPEEEISVDNFYINDEGITIIINDKHYTYADINTKDYKYFAFLTYGAKGYKASWGSILAYKEIPTYEEVTNNDYSVPRAYHNENGTIMFIAPDASIDFIVSNKTFIRSNSICNSYVLLKDDQYICYINFDLKNTDGTTFLAGAEVRTKYFNFKYNDLIYSIYSQDLFLSNYTVVFKSGYYAIIYTADTLPEYYYENYTHYLKSYDNTVYIYNFKTNEVENFTSERYFAFKPEQIIYSNFSLYSKDENGISDKKIFDTVGEIYFDGYLGSKATGNITASGSTGGNSYLDDYVNNKSDDDNDSFIVSDGFNSVYSNFGFVDGVQKNVNGMIEVITDVEEAPKFKINVNSKYYTGTLTIIDLSWYEPYKEYGDNVICIFCYLVFLWRMLCKLPDIIKGAGASAEAGNMISNAVLYSQYGIGRPGSSKTKL